jgi:hypothetical protein
MGKRGWMELMSLLHPVQSTESLELYTHALIRFKLVAVKGTGGNFTITQE